MAVESSETMEAAKDVNSLGDLQQMAARSSEIMESARDVNSLGD